MTNQVNKEQAEKEVNRWLDMMDIPSENRQKENVKQYIDALVKATMDGHLIFNENDTITQKLKFPLGDGNTTEIVYDFRFEIGEFNKKTKGIPEASDIDWSVARLSLVSEKKLPESVFLKLKRADYYIASKLTVFF